MGHGARDDVRIFALATTLMINDHLVGIWDLKHHVVPPDHPTSCHPSRFRIGELDIKAFIKRDRAPGAWGHRVMGRALKDPETFYPLKCGAVLCWNGPSQLHLTPHELRLQVLDRRGNNGPRGDRRPLLATPQVEEQESQP
jgi:hypothetical protein